MGPCRWLCHLVLYVKKQKSAFQPYAFLSNIYIYIYMYISLSISLLIRHLHTREKFHDFRVNVSSCNKRFLAPFEQLLNNVKIKKKKQMSKEFIRQVDVGHPRTETIPKICLVIIVSRKSQFDQKSIRSSP